MPGERAQTILSRWRADTQEGWRLGLDEEGALEFVVAAGGRTWRVATGAALLSREWVLGGGELGRQRPAALS